MAHASGNATWLDTTDGTNTPLTADAMENIENAIDTNKDAWDSVFLVKRFYPTYSNLQSQSGMSSAFTISEIDGYTPIGVVGIASNGIGIMISEAYVKDTTTCAFYVYNARTSGAISDTRSARCDILYVKSVLV